MRPPRTRNQHRTRHTSPDLSGLDTCQPRTAPDRLQDRHTSGQSGTLDTRSRFQDCSNQTHMWFPQRLLQDTPDLARSPCTASHRLLSRFPSDIGRAVRSIDPDKRTLLYTECTRPDLLDCTTLRDIPSMMTMPGRDTRTRVDIARTRSVLLQSTILHHTRSQCPRSCTDTPILRGTVCTQFVRKPRTFLKIK